MDLKNATKTESSEAPNNNNTKEDQETSSPKFTFTIQSNENPNIKKTERKNSLKKSKVKLKPLEIDKIKKSKKKDKKKLKINSDDKIKKKYNEINKFQYIYSPRTTFIKELMKETELYNDIGVSFDPVAIKIIKSFFKERLGELTEFEFIKVVINNLHSWHPEIPDRIRTLCNLLIQLFYDIDLNDNKTIEWDEFTNYIIHSGENIFQNKLGYQLKYYSPAKHYIEPNEFNDMITYSFYINKLNLVGIVFDGRSYIDFYSGDSFKKTTVYIDIKETQNKIDKLEISLLNKRAEEIMIKKEEEKKLKNQLHNELMIKKGRKQSVLFNLNSNNLNKKTENNNNIVININDEDGDSDEKDNITPKKIKKKNINKEKNEEIKEDNTRAPKPKDFYKKLTILCACYVEEYNILFISSSNKIISAWKFVEHHFVNINYLGDSDNSIIIRGNDIYSCPLLSADFAQNAMDWDPMQKKLYSGQGDGKILIWDIFKSKGKEEDVLDYKKAKLKHDKENLLEKLSKTKKNIEQKNNMSKSTSFEKNQSMIAKQKQNISHDGVSSIKVLGKMQMIAAGYYNGCVIVWDLMLREYRKFYSDQSTGIYQIVYDENRKLIFTCGFTHDIHIYDPYIDDFCVNKLSGHNWSINSIGCNESINEFVSIDIYGNIKIWDLTNYYNYQTLNTNETVSVQNNKKKISSNQKMILLPKLNKIFTYGERVMLFSKETVSLPDLCDSQAVLGCFYRDHKFQIVTVCLKKIKVWNIFNGKILRIYEDVLSNQNAEITSFVSDKFMKKLYIGESTGVISCIDINVGKIIVNYEKHNSEIISLKYDNKNYILLSLSFDGEIKIHKELDLTKIHVLKSITLDFCKTQIISYSETFSRLILGSDHGEIRFYDVEYLRFDTFNELLYKGKTIPKKYEALSSMFIFDDLPLLLASYESGNNRLILIPPNKPSYIVLYEFKNYNEKDGKKYLIKILSCCYDKKSKILFTGDFFGVVDCYSLKNFFSIIDEENKEINLDMIKALEEKENDNLIELIYTMEAHKGCIKEIVYPNINPNIIITTGNDSCVKLFNAKNGKYIDELSQQNEKNKEYPLGIKYHLTDPFVSKVDDVGDNYKEEEHIIYREDIKNLKYNKLRSVLNNMRKNKSSITDYCNKITELNAKEKLFLLNLNNKIPEGKSSLWKFEPDLDEIKSKTKKKYDEKLKELFKKDDSFLYNNKYDLIESDNYYPLFIKQMDEEELENYSHALNSKIRKMQLTTSKIILKNNELMAFEKEKEKENRKIDYSELKLAKLKDKYSKNKLYTKEVQSRYAFKKNKFKTNEEKFNNYRENFQRDIQDLIKSFNDKIIPVDYLLGKNKKNKNGKNDDEGKLPPINNNKTYNDINNN